MRRKTPTQEDLYNWHAFRARHKVGRFVAGGRRSKCTFEHGNNRAFDRHFHYYPCGSSRTTRARISKSREAARQQAQKEKEVALSIAINKTQNLPHHLGPGSIRHPAGNQHSIPMAIVASLLIITCLMTIAQRVFTRKQRQNNQFSKESASINRKSRRRPALNFIKYLVFLLCASISKWAFINNKQSIQLHHDLAPVPDNNVKQPFSINVQPEVLYDGGTAIPG